METRRSGKAPPGVRPVGEPEGGKPTMAPNGFYWNYFVVRFEKSSIVSSIESITPSNRSDPQ